MTIYVLYLNPIHTGTETYTPVASSSNKETLDQLLKNERLTEPYHDGEYYRTFRKGILHDFNPPSINGVNSLGYYEGIVQSISREELEEEYIEEMQDALSAYDEAFDNVEYIL